MFRYRLTANLMRAVGPRSRFLEGAGLFQRWKAPSEGQLCRQMASSSFAWQNNRTLYIFTVMTLFGIGNAYYAYTILTRARQRDVDRMERFERMERQMNAKFSSGI